jgi:hypothetical protein
MQPWLIAAIFAESFLTYTLLRRLDERSTALLAERIDLQKHELNPTITRLAKKIGLKRAFIVTWLAIACSVATGDVWINQRFPYGIPVFALIVGFGHVLAWANNTRVANLVDRVGVDEFERDHDRRMRELASLGGWQRLKAVAKDDPGSFIMLVLALPMVAVLGYAMIATELFTRVITSDLYVVGLLNVAFCFLIALMSIQPAFALGPLILSRRYSGNKNGKDERNQPPSPTVHFDLPIGVVTQALDAARADGGSVVRISLPLFGTETGQ